MATDIFDLPYIAPGAIRSGERGRTAEGAKALSIRMNYPATLTVILGLVVVSLTSRRLQGSVLTGPMIVVVFGLLVGPSGLNWVPLSLTTDALHWLAEIIHDVEPAAPGPNDPGCGWSSGAW